MKDKVGRGSGCMHMMSRVFEEVGCWQPRG